MPRDEIIKHVKNNQVDGILCLLTDRMDKELFDLCPDLEVISTYSVGVNHIDLKECKKRNIRVGYTPNVLTKATAELAVSLLLTVARRLPEANKNVLNGGWGTWKPEWMLGKDVTGSTVGVVGMGRIGEKFGKIMKFAFNCRVCYSDIKEREDIEWAEYMSLDDLLSTSDFVVPHCSLTSETEKMFSKREFEMMKSDSIFINTTRGEVVDQKELYNALKEKKIMAAGLDVTTPEPLNTDHELLTLNNCFVVPHLGSATRMTRDEMAVVSAKNLIAGLEGNDMVYEFK